MNQTGHEQACKDFSFWANEIEKSETIYDLFEICEELLEDVGQEPEKGDLVIDYVGIGEKYKDYYSDLFSQIDKRLHEFGGQNIPFEDWYWEIDDGR